MNIGDDLTSRLVWLSRELGREERLLAILGEGNTSADIGDGTFLVKASGSNLTALQPDDLTKVNFEPILEAVDDPSLTDADIRQVLLSARADPDARLPSVETFMHAVCLHETGAKWIGHCHPVSVLSVICSTHGVAPFERHLFPDSIVVCGRHVATVPYIDPGIELARAIRDEMRRFRSELGHTPRVILLANHGPVALGATEREVLNIILMLDKWARVLAGVLAAGGPQFLPDSQAERIDTRPDEHYRRAQISAQS